MKNARMQYDGASSTEIWGRVLSTWLGLVPAIMDDANVTSWENICNTIDAIFLEHFLYAYFQAKPSILVCRIPFSRSSFRLLPLILVVAFFLNHTGFIAETEMFAVRF